MKQKISGSSSKGESPSRLIDARIQGLDDWRGDMHFGSSQRVFGGRRIARPSTR
jgi:hypothetical protein